MLLKEAYKKIFKTEPDNLEEWEIARDIINNWNVPVLGEELAKQVIFRIVNHIQYPSKEITGEVVLKAENFATELFGDEVSDEPHMAELERLETRYIETPNKGPKLI